MSSLLLTIALLSGIHTTIMFIFKKDMPIFSAAIFVVVCWNCCFALSIITLLMCVWVIAWRWDEFKK